MKGKIRDIIIGILTGTLMIFIGYSLNDYLAKERISIEHVEFLPEKNRLSRNPEIFSHLMNSDQYSNWLINLQTRTVQKLIYSRDKENYSPSEVNILIASTKEFIKFLIEDSKACRKLEQNIKNYNPDSDLKPIVEEARSIFFYFYFYEDDPQKNLKNIKGQLQRRLSDNEFIKVHANNLLTYLINYKASRTGGIDITIIFLNSGNTDGLIMPEGTLVLVGEGRKERMPIALKESKVMKIAKRSMMEVSFVVDEGKAVQDELNNFKELVKKGFPISGVIEIKDFRTDLIRSKTYGFPVRS